MQRIALVVLACLAGCRSESEAPVTSDGKKPAWLRETVEPTNLQITLDSTRAQSQIVQPVGGTVEATGQDGTFFLLEIPEGALLLPTPITMTPVLHAEGLPGTSTMVATVQLQPEGLQLHQPATLTIQPPNPPPETETYGYAYAATGNDAHLYPVRGDSNSVEFQLSHFSGYGILRIKPTDNAIKELREAALEHHRLTAAIATSLARIKCRFVRENPGYVARLADSVIRRLERECANVSGEASMEDVLKLVVEYYKFAVRPLYQLAQKDPAAYDCAVAAGISFQRELQLLGEGDLKSATGVWETLRNQLEEQSKLEAETRAGYVKAMVEELRKRCQKGDVTVLGQAIGLTQQSILLGDSRLTASLKTVIGSCLEFEVEFDSEITNRAPYALFSYHVSGKGPWTVSQYLPKGEKSEDSVVALRYVSHQARGKATSGLAGILSGISPAGTIDGVLRIHSITVVQKAVPDSTTTLDCHGWWVLVPDPQPDTIQVMLTIEAPSEVSRNRLGPGLISVDTSQNWHQHFYNFRRHYWFQPNADMEQAPAAPAEGLRIALRLGRVQDSGWWRMDFAKDTTSGIATTTADGWSLLEKGHIIVRHNPGL